MAAPVPPKLAIGLIAGLLLASVFSLFSPIIGIFMFLITIPLSFVYLLAYFYPYIRDFIESRRTINEPEYEIPGESDTQESTETSWNHSDVSHTDAWKQRMRETTRVNSATYEYSTSTTDNSSETTTSSQSEPSESDSQKDNSKRTPRRSRKVRNAESTLNLTYPYSEDELDEAYRKKVKETHPDTENGSEEKFKNVQSAYELLTEKHNQ